MNAPDFPLLEINAINVDQELVYNKVIHDNKKYTEDMFEGFVSSILFLSNEMGNQLSSITLKNVNLFFKSFEDLIIVLNVDARYENESSIEELFQQLLKLEEWNYFKSKHNNMIDLIKNQLDEKIQDILEEFDNF